MRPAKSKRNGNVFLLYAYKDDEMPEREGVRFACYVDGRPTFSGVPVP